MRKLIHTTLVLLLAICCFPLEALSQCSFTVSDYTPCGLTIVNFSVNTPGVGYTWDMNGDNISDAAGSNAFYIYPYTAIPISYTVTLFQNGIACSTETLIVQPPPDPTIGVIPGNGILTGNQIRVCSGSPNATLSIFNASTTLANNQSYSINWGDGNIQNLDASEFTASDVIDHAYNGFGYYTISVTTTSMIGCQAVKSYLFYNGSNPSVGMANPGNTVGLCVPATITFPITNTSTNPTGTVYNVYISGELVATYTQENIPAAYTHTFLETSCGKGTVTGNYENAYDIQIVATNPCGSSQATIEPIELSSPPEPEILLDEPTIICVDEGITFSNGTTGIGEVISGNPSTCSTNLSPSWSITPGVPGVHWNILSGNVFSADELEIEFLIPGDYTVVMTINSQACGAYSASQTITIIDPPFIDATLDLVNASAPATSDECAPTVASFTNLSTGDSLVYEWEISPSTGWQFWNGSDDLSTHLELLILEPGSYNVGLKATNDCKTEWWDTTIVIISTPIISLDPIPDFCQSAELDFSSGNTNFDDNGGTFGTFNWSFPGATPATSNDQYPNNIQYNSPGEYIVTLNTSNQCGPVTYRDTFTIVQPGSLVVDNDYVVCANAASFAVSATPNGGTWTGVGVDANGWYTPDENNEGVNTLVYTFNQGGCDLMDSMQVTVLPLPIVDPGPDQTACINDASIVISGASPAGGTWTVNNGGVITNNNNFDAQNSGPGNYTLTYTYTNSNGCSDSATKSLTIYDLPNVEAGPNQTFCNTPTNVQLSGFSPAGGTWSGTGVNPNGVFNAVNTAGVGQYTLYYYYTNQFTNCQNVDSLVVTVIEAATADAGPDINVCVDATPINLSGDADPVGGTWTANGSNGLFGAIFNPAVAGVGTHLLTYSYGQGSCAASDNIQITIFDLPNVNAGQDREVCVSETSLSLNGSPIGGTWSTNTAGVLNSNTFLPNASGAGTFQLTYTYVNANGCTQSDEVEITVLPLPVLNTNDTLYCNTAGMVTLPYTTPLGGTWSGTGVYNNFFDPQQAGGAGNYTVTYSYTDSNGCSNTIDANVQVIEPTTVDAGPDQVFCIDQIAFDLSNNATPMGGTWNSTSNGLNGNIFDPALAGIGSHILTYRYGTGNCETIDQVTIVVNPLPNVNAGPDSEICVSETSLSLNGSPTGGTWSTNSAGVINGNTFLPNASGAGTFQLTYTYADATNCTESDVLEITVHPLPVLNTNDTLYCNTPGLVTLPYTTPLGGTWNGLGVNNNFFDPQQAGGAGNYTLTYSYTDSNGCTNTIDANIQVIEPTTVEAGPDQSFCIDQMAFDLSNNASPMGGTWNSTSTGLNGNIFAPALAGVGTHILTYRYGTGNCETIDQVTIVVNPLPNVHAGQDQAICISTKTLLLNGTPSGGVWTSNSGGLLNGNEFSPNASGAGDYNFTYTYTNENNCTSSDDVNVLVNPLPVLNTNDTTYCSTPGLVQLPYATPTGGTWTGNGVINNVFDPQGAGGPGFYTLIYSYTDSNGCTNSIESNIQVVMPNPLTAGNDHELCLDGGDIDLSINASPQGGNWLTTSSAGLNGTIFDPVEAGVGTHLIIYSQGTGNCEVRDSLTITVNPVPQVFAGIDLSVCFGTTAFVLTGTSPQGGTWSGNGLADPQAGIFDPSNVAPGDYVLTYSFTNAFGCYQEDSRTITVFPMEEPAFDLPPLACRNENVTFINNSPADYNSTWNFGDNEGSNDFNPTHAFTNTGTYSVLLTVENEFGCIDTISHPITITDLPVAYFVPDTIEACADLEVHLDNQSVGEGLTYFWDFGNGVTSTEPNPDIFFLNAGVNDTTYVISLTITNLCGTSYYEDLIIIHPEPNAEMGISPQTECSPLVIDFANSSTGGITSYYWDFGNGQTSTDPLPEPQTYTTDTTTTIYTAMLIATNVCGSDTIYKDIVVEPADVQAFFEVSDNDGCAPHEVSFENFSSNGAVIEWDFGDGNTSSEIEPTHVFETPGIYEVIQFAHSECGYDTATVFIEVIAPPVVEFTHVNNICQGQIIQFENLSDNISGAYWDFGDGDTSQLNSPTHVFDSLGTYTITLTGYSTVNQCPATYTSEVQVLGLPTASFDVPTTYGCAPLSIEFENNSEGIAFQEWDFGDGNTSILESPTHVFIDSGTYEVKLTVTDANGCFNDTSIFNILVNPVPEANFAFEKEQVCGLPAAIYFENLSIGASGFEWNFGDSSQSVFNDPTHTYHENGDFEVQLVAVNQYGCRDTTDDAFTIYPNPVAEFSISETEGCSPVQVQFDNRSSLANSYHWDFGDGHTSDEETPTHVFETAGNYDVSLTVNIDDTCFDTIVLNNSVTVHPTPTANFTPEERINDGRKTGDYDFINHSEYADYYFWDFGDGNTSEEESPNHRYFTNAVRQIYLETTTDFGCVADTLINLHPEFVKGLFVPNGFSPEQGIGDVRLFKPKGVGIKEYHIQVYSTYGQLLWESKALEDGQPAEAWDGVYNGKILPQDVYVWKASAIFEDGTVWRGQETKKGKYQIMGSVILLR